MTIDGEQTPPAHARTGTSPDSGPAPDPGHTRCQGTLWPAAAGPSPGDGTGAPLPRRDDTRARRAIARLSRLVEIRDGRVVAGDAPTASGLDDPSQRSACGADASERRWLGDFLWARLEDTGISGWADPILQWLPRVLPDTDHWDRPADLERAASFFEAHLLARDAVRIRARLLDLLTQRPGLADGHAILKRRMRLAESLHHLGDDDAAMQQYREALHLHADTFARTTAAIAGTGARMDGDGSRSRPDIGLAADCTALLEDIATAHDRLGMMLLDRSASDDAQVQLTQARAVRTWLRARETSESEQLCGLIGCHVRTGRALQSAGDLAGALRHFLEGLSLATRHAARRRADLACSRNLALGHEHIGHVLNAQGDPGSALVELRTALVINEERVRRDPGDTDARYALAGIHDRIAAVLETCGKHEVASDHRSDAQRIRASRPVRDPNAQT